MHRILERAAALKPPLTFPGFRSMLAEYGGKRTADLLLAQPKVSDGFTKLVLHSLETGNREALQLSVEHLVLEHPWRQLFSPTQRRVAQRRLREVGYDPPADEDATAQSTLAAATSNASVAIARQGKPTKRIRDLPAPSRRHTQYAKTIDAEGWAPLILCDTHGCYWNMSTVQTRDRRVHSGISTAAREHLVGLVQFGRFGNEASDALVDAAHWDYINDNLLISPNSAIIAQDRLRILALPPEPSIAGSAPTPIADSKASIPLGPTTGPRPTSWTGLVSRNASVHAYAYVFQFGGREAWKIGHAIDVKDRLAEVNKHVPYEILGEQWRVCHSHICSTQDEAYAVEQRLLALLRTSTSVGERVTCTRAAIDAAWTAVLEELLSSPPAR